MAHLAQAGRGRANGGQRRLVGVGERVQDRRAQLLGTPFGLDAALVGEGPVTVEGDGDQRGDGVVGQRAGFAAHHQRAHRHRPQADNTPPQAGDRIVVRAAEVVDVLRQLARVDVPIAGLIDLMQVGVEDRDGFERKDFMHQLGQLRPRLDVQIQFQRAPGELIEIAHLPAPRLGLLCVVFEARGEAADHQRDDHKGQQGNRVGGISGQIGLRLARDEDAVQENG